jgi:hypothetical protein
MPTIKTHEEVETLRLHTVKKWRYRTYLLNRTPMEGETTITVVFTLS